MDLLAGERLGVHSRVGGEVRAKALLSPAKTHVKHVFLEIDKQPALWYNKL